MSGALGMLLATSAGAGASGYIARFTGNLQPGQLGNTFGYIPSTIGVLTSSNTPANQFSYLGATLTITTMVDVVAPAPQSYITITGWNSNPGSAAIYSLTWNNNEVVYAGGTGPPGYVYTSGTPNSATWTFSTGSVVFGFTATGTNAQIVLKG